MSILFNFVDNHDQNNYNFQTVQSELNDRLKEFSDQIKETGVYMQGPFHTLCQYIIEEVVIGLNYVAFRLQDGRVCRISYLIKSEKASKVEKVQKRPSKGVLDKLVNYGSGSSRSDQSYLGSTSNRSSIPHRIARYQMLSSHSSTPRVNFIREMQRQGIYLARTFSTPISASEVPEDLIEQCQTVLQGKSRQLIIRELQRTNLDVNMAVNNLLSRDDEADENGGASNLPEDWEETDDLLSLLDQADNPLFEAAITENGLSIPEDIFPNIRLRRETLYPSMLATSELETYADRRKRRRLDCQLRLSSASGNAGSNTESQSFYNPSYDESSPSNQQDDVKSDNLNSNTNTNGNSSNRKNSMTFGNQLEWWKEPVNNNNNTSTMNPSTNKRRDMRFIKISGMYSELIGLSVDNELHQWKWSDSEPWTSNTNNNNNNSSSIGGSCGSTADILFNNSSTTRPFYHPRLPSLNLIGEKVIQLSSSNTRATVLTQSRKLASWMDEMIAPIFPPLSRYNTDHQLSTVQNLKLEHPAQQFQEIKDESVSEIYTSSLVSAVKCTSGNIYWWGVIPFKYRKNAIEKNRERLAIPSDDNKSGNTNDSSNRRSKQYTSASSNNCSELLQPGSFVCMRSSPIFHAGAIGFTVAGGVPKIGTLLEDAWKVEDVCRFSVKPVQTLVNERRHSSGMNQMSTMNHPASFDPLTHENMCPHLNASFMYGLLGRSGGSSAASTSVSKQVTISTSDAALHDTNQSSVSMKTASSANVAASAAGVSTSVTWAEMPPPPSPASSTCSDQSGPVKISPGPFKRKKHQSHSYQGDLINEVNTESRPPSSSSTSHHRSYKSPSSSHYIPMYDYEPLAGHKRSLTPDDTSTTANSSHTGSKQQMTNQHHQQQQLEEYEEDWCLKDVIFLEDGRTQPIGVVLKVDGEIVAVKFLKDSERACVAVNCAYSPLSTVSDPHTNTSINTSSTSTTSASGTSSSNPYPFSWLNDCRLLRKEELVIVKQPLVPRVPEIVQKTPKCLSLDFVNENSTPNCYSDNIIGMAIENELVHLLLRKLSNSSLIEYKIISLTKKIVSSNKLATLSSGFFGSSDNKRQLSGILSHSLESEFCELKPGNLFNAERHKPLFIRDGNGTVYPITFTDSHSATSSSSGNAATTNTNTSAAVNTGANSTLETITSPIWVDLAPVRCVDFALITRPTQTSSFLHDQTANKTSTTSSCTKPKSTQFLLGFVVVESQNLMTHILRCEDKKISSLLESFPMLQQTQQQQHQQQDDDDDDDDDDEEIGGDSGLYEKMLLENLDGQRNILHVAISMCEATSNQEVHWKLGNFLNYRSRRKDSAMKTGGGNTVSAEDLSLGQNRSTNWSSMEIGSNNSSMPYRRWRDSHSNEIGGYSRSSSNNTTSNSVQFKLISSTITHTPPPPPPPNQNTGNNNFTSGGWLYPPIRSEQKDRRAASYRIVNLLLNHSSMDKHLMTLLSQKNSDGLTPFMQAISQRLYHIALFILDCVMDLCQTQFISVKDTTNLSALKMLFPSAIPSVGNSSMNGSPMFSYQPSFTIPFPGSSQSVAPLEDNPLQILCHNDGCSFVWTGPDHIRQDIFECKTCGLTESLCCCTECARICHAGHDCHLKKTSPTAYCDCWEKCKCRTLILGDNLARLDLLKRLLHDTDFGTVQNRDREHILVFLVRTVERQLREQKQARTTTTATSSSSSSRRHNLGGSGSAVDSGFTSRNKLSSQSMDPQMPEYGFDPGYFTISALEMLLGNWPAIETVFRMGDRSDFLGSVLKSMNAVNSNGINPYSDDDVYLNYQSSSEQLDLFVFTLIMKTRSDNVDILLATINKQFQVAADSNTSKRSVKTVAKRFVRSVARIYLTLQLQMASDYSSRKRGSTSGGANSTNAPPTSSSSTASASRLSAYHMLSGSGAPPSSVAAVVAASTNRPLETCRHIFESLLSVSLAELPRIAVDLLAPIQTGLLKPTGYYQNCANMSDAIKNMDQIFQISNNSVVEKVSDSSRISSDGGRIRSNIANDHNYPSSSMSTNRRASSLATITIHGDNSSANHASTAANTINSSFGRRNALSSIPSIVPPSFSITTTTTNTTTSGNSANSSSSISQINAQSAANSNNNTNISSSNTPNIDTNNTRMSGSRTSSSGSRRNAPGGNIRTHTRVINSSSNNDEDDDDDDEEYEEEGDDDDMNGGGATAVNSISSHPDDTRDTRSALQRSSQLRGNRRTIRRMSPNYQHNPNDETSRDATFEEENDDEVVEEDEENDEEEEDDDDMVTHHNVNDDSSRLMTTSSNNPNNDMAPTNTTISGNNSNSRTTNIGESVTRNSNLHHRMRRSAGQAHFSSEESDADGITVEQDLEHENDMDAYDEDHDDTDIVPESEDSESDNSITSSICVTLEHMETDAVSSRPELVSSGGRRSRRRRRQILDARNQAPLVQPESDMTLQSGVEGKHGDDDSNMDENIDDGGDGNSSTPLVRMTRLDEMRILPTTTTTHANTTISSSNTSININNNNNSGGSNNTTTLVTGRGGVQRNVDLDASVVSEEGDSEEIDDEDEDEDDEEIDNGVSGGGLVPGGGGGDSSQNTEDEEQQSSNSNHTNRFTGLLQSQSNSGTNNNNSSQGNIGSSSSVTGTGNNPGITGNTNSSGYHRSSMQAGGGSHANASASQFSTQTTQIQLSRSFCHLLKLISHLLGQLQPQHNQQHRHHLEHTEAVSQLTQTLGPVWLWICRCMDYLESQVCFSLAFQRRQRHFSNIAEENSIPSSSSRKKNSATSTSNATGSTRPILRFELIHPHAVSSDSASSILYHQNQHNHQHHQLQHTQSQSHTQLNSTQLDSASRMDFLKFLVSTMRASSDEHADSVPMSLFAVDYCHLAYLVDGLLFLMRSCFMTNAGVNPQVSQHTMKKEPTIEGEYNTAGMYSSSNTMETEETVLVTTATENTQQDAFFYRADHPLGWLGLGASSFSTPVADSLPLAHMPQLLQPPGPSDEVFGVLRRFDSCASNLSELDRSKSEQRHQQDPGHYGANSSPEMEGRDFEGSMPLHMGVSSKWADSRTIFSSIPVTDLRTRWRYSLEMMSNSFESTVASEPGSVLAEFTHFSIKETKFRKEMERLRNQCRRDISLIVSRDRESVLRGTLTQLNQTYTSRTNNNTTNNNNTSSGNNANNNNGSSNNANLAGYYCETTSIFPGPSSATQSSSNSLPPLLCHRFKVKFTGEPGEGNGVTRSFLTVFAEYAISDEPLTAAVISQPPAPTSTSSAASSIPGSNVGSQGRKLPRVYGLNRSSNNTSGSSEHNYIRLPARSTTSSSNNSTLPHHSTRIIPSTAGSSSSSNSMMRYVQSLASRANSNMPTTRQDPPNASNSFMSAFAIFASSGTTTANTNTSSSNSNTPFYSLTPILTTSTSTSTTNTTTGTPIRTFISRLHPNSSSSNTPATNNPPPDYNKIMRIAEPPSNTTNTTNTSSNTSSNVDAASLAANFINSIGTPTASASLSSSPVWIGSNWLSSSSSTASASNQARRSIRQPSRSSMQLSTLLRNWFGSLNEALLKEIALGVSMNLLGGSSDVDVLVEEMANENVRSADIINLILTHYTSWNVLHAGTSSQPPPQPLPPSTSGLGSSSSITLSHDADSPDDHPSLTSSGAAGASLLPNSSYSPEVNMEVSLLTFNLHLESLVKSYIQEHPKSSSSSASSANKNAQPDTASQERPELAPLFWQPGHTDFYAPRRASVPTLISSGVSPDDSTVNSTRNALYRCVGRVIGLSLLMNETMPRLKLSRHILKFILGWPLAWHDFAFFNCQLYESLRQLMHTALSSQGDNDSTEHDPLLEYHLNFSLTPRPEEGGSPHTILPLVQGGEDVTVTSGNVYHYVKKYCTTRMISLVKVQLEQLKMGVYDVLPRSALVGLSPEDLRLLLNGTDEINVDVLLGYTTFLDESQGGALAFNMGGLNTGANSGGGGGAGSSNTGGLGAGDQASQDRVLRFKRWFNSVVRNFNSVQRQNLLYFWTSSPALPASNQGFQPMPSITIRPADDLHLPTANTCISRLYIPLYSTKQILRDKLLQAIETKCFGFV